LSIHSLADQIYSGFLAVALKF